MKSVKGNIKVSLNASRLELLVRFFLSIIYSLVFSVIGLILSLALIFQFFIILFTGKRHKGITDFTRAYLDYLIEVDAYLMMATDERPPFWPEDKF